MVIGSGIGGLSAGIALQQAGLEVEVFERAPELHEVGAGISLWANALQALRYLGLDETVRRRGASGGASNLRTWRGDILTEGSPEVQRRFGEVVVSLHRAELQQLLLDAFGEQHVRRGKTLSRFERTEQGVVAHFADDSQTEGDLLIGADGLYSAVRAQLHGSHAPRYAGYSAWRAVASFSLKPDQAGESWGYGQRFGCLPLGGGRTYWFATRTQRAGEKAPEGEKVKLLQLFKNWHAPIPVLIAATPDERVLHNDIFDRPVLETWGEGRVTLLGDAAHPMTPNLGQGACQALEDAAVLGACFRNAENVSAALRRYEARRQPRTNRFVRQSRALGTVAQWSSPPLVGVRSALFKHGLSRLQSHQLQSLLSFEV